VPTESDVAPNIRGLLKSDVQPGERELRWFEPSAMLATFIQRIWSAQWKIASGEYRSQPVLPHPSANLVVANGDVTMIGVITKAAVQRLEGHGYACGAKLQPGALRAFGVEKPWLLRDSLVAAADLFGGAQLVLTSHEPDDMASEIESYLAAQRPSHDATSRKAREIVDMLENDRDILSVSQLAGLLDLSERSIQDICHRALGVHPKRLIRCLCLQDALSRLEERLSLNLSAVAQDFGYLDRAHFRRDFKRVTGVSPGRY
jgi:AraC-like DNA-binding protein